MSRPDTSEQSSATYECHDCRHREKDTAFPVSCPECGGPMQNIAVPRER